MRLDLGAVHLQLVDPGRGRTEARKPVGHPEPADVRQLQSRLAQPHVTQRQAGEEVAGHPANRQTIAGIERSQGEELADHRGSHRRQLQQGDDAGDQSDQHDDTHPRASEPAPGVVRGNLRDVRLGGRHRAPARDRVGTQGSSRAISLRAAAAWDHVGGHTGGGRRGLAIAKTRRAKRLTPMIAVAVDWT